MTAFDIAASLVLLVSALVGLWRGGVREIVSLTAFTLAALAAVFALPFSGPIAHHSLHPAWMAKILAVVVVFLAVYIGLRLLGGAVSAMLHRQATLGTLDRTAGLALGIGRGLVALGGFYLIFHAATPPELEPEWIVGARLYPLSRLSGHLLASVAPSGIKGVGGLGRVLRDRMSEDDARDNAAPAATPPTVAPQPPYETYRRHHRHTLAVQSDAVQGP